MEDAETSEVVELESEFERTSFRFESTSGATFFIKDMSLCIRPFVAMIVIGGLLIRVVVVFEGVSEATELVDFLLTRGLDF